jgi:hypothetical protein
MRATVGDVDFYFIFAHGNNKKDIPKTIKQILRRRTYV